MSFINNYHKIENFLLKHDIKNYTIKKNGFIDVDGDVILAYKNFKKIPVKFDIITGTFSCQNCKNLKTLKGSPNKCKKFDCSYCINLESLEGAPEECETFNCRACINIISLKGVPEKCKEFWCNNCKKLESFKGAPKECETFNCSNCDNVSNFIETPSICKIFNCNNCKNLKTLEGAPKECEWFDCSLCKNLEYSIEHFPKCERIFIKFSSFETLHNLIDRNIFMELINLNTNIEKDEFLLDLVDQKKINLNDILDLLITDKYKNKYRGASAGNKYNF